MSVPVQVVPSELQAGERRNMHPINGLQSVVFERGQPTCKHWVVDDRTSHP